MVTILLLKDLLLNTNRLAKYNAPSLAVIAAHIYITAYYATKWHGCDERCAPYFV